MTKKVKFAAIAMATIGLLWVGCTAPTAEVRSADLRSLTLQQLDVGLTLDLKNPNEFSIPVEAIDWGLSLFDTSVADGRAQPDAEIAANSSTDVDVPISLRLSDLSQTASRVASSSQIPWAIGGTCHFDIPTGSVAVDFSRDGEWDNPLR